MKHSALLLYVIGVVITSGVYANSSWHTIRPKVVAQQKWRPSRKPATPSPFSNDRSSYNYNDYKINRGVSDIEFQSIDSRKGFVNKVYSIFSVQILTTMLVVNLAIRNGNFASFLRTNSRAVSIASGLVSLGSVSALSKSKELAQTMPWNFIILGIFTLAQSLGLSVITTFINASILVIAAMHTLTAFLGITLFSTLFSVDLTGQGATLLAVLTSVLVGGIANLFFRVPILENVIPGVAAVLFAAYIYHDTQLIMGGKHREKQFGRKDYILAALSLYMDVINLFLELVKILQSMEDKKRQKEDR